MKLVNDARRAWQWFSVQALAVLALVPVIWAELPVEAQALVPAEWRPWVLAGVAMAGLVGRLIKQGQDDA